MYIYIAMRILFPLAIICFVIISSLNLYAGESARQYVEEGDRYRDNFRNLQAARQYEKAYGLNESFGIIKKLILSYNDAGEDLRSSDKEKAEHFFRKAIKYAETSRDKYSEEADNYFLLALTYGNLARFSNGKEKVSLARNVEKNIKKMIELKPDFAPSYVVLGVYYREVSELSWLEEQLADKLMGGLPDGSVDESIKALEKAVSLDPDAIYTNFELAKTYESIKEYNKAEKYYKRVTELPVTDHLDCKKKEKSRNALSRIARKTGD